jgi:hypothetical protein
MALTTQLPPTDIVVPVALDQGLDTTSPPLMTKPGALIDCLNYEMTNHAGYRRIDGYEAYDGWSNGEVVDYYTVTVNTVTANLTAVLVAGATIFKAATGVASQALGTVLAYSGTSSAGTLTYAPANKGAPIIPSGTGLAMTYSTSGVTPTFTASNNASNGLTTDTPSTFVTNVRAYATTLRNQVTAMTTPIAGVHWFRNNLIVAMDCPMLTYTDTTSTKNSVGEGYYVSYLSNLYLVVDKQVVGNTVTLLLENTGLGSVNNTSTVKVEGNNSTITVLNSTSPSLTFNASSNASLYSANNIATNTSRGLTLLKRTSIIQFTGGLAAAANHILPGLIMAVGTSVGAFNNVYIKNVVITSGSYATNDAAGYVEVVLSLTGSAGNQNNFDATQDLMSTGGATKYADITAVTLSKIAGTTALRAKDTRYLWQTYNFKGQEDDTEAYGVTGNSRGFWARAYPPPLTSSSPNGIVSVSSTEYFLFGNIITDFTNSALDTPKYISRVGGSLALGFAGGAVEVSVPGEPRNFNGVNGATEVDTSDALTGLLEVAGNSLICFGKRSIHRLSGTLPDITLETISGNSGAFDYTAVLVGATPVFAGPSGISTLDQTASYGDFQGRRLSYQVSATLNPKLAPGTGTTALGGCIMALPVREKDQYRLWLSTGEVISLTITEDGAKVMKSNYGLGTDLRVPFAWTSEIADNGKERLVVVWDATLATLNVNVNGVRSTVPDPKMMYRLDTGWGFNGLTFTSRFDLAHVFSPDNRSYTSIPKVRMHGYGYGLATLDVKSAGVENDFDQVYHSATQDISMPATFTTFYRTMQPVTSIVDQANWGLGIKLRIQSSKAESLTTTEPSHVCQVLILHINTEGVPDA